MEINDSNGNINKNKISHVFIEISKFKKLLYEEKISNIN